MYTCTHSLWPGKKEATMNHSTEVASSSHCHQEAHAVLETTKAVAKVVVQALSSKTVHAPENRHPSLKFLDHGNHVMCQVSNWYETLAVIISHGNYSKGPTHSESLRLWFTKK